MALDPLSVMWRMGVGHMLFLARRYEEAVETELTVLEVEPHFWLAHWVLGMAYEQRSESLPALDALRHADEFSGGNPMARGLLGRILALLGHVDEAREYSEELTTRKKGLRRHTRTSGHNPRRSWGMDSTFEWFERAAPEGGYLLSFLNISAVFDSLRPHSRFDALRRLVGLT